MRTAWMSKGLYRRYLTSYLSIAVLAMILLSSASSILTRTMREEAYHKGPVQKMHVVLQDAQTQQRALMDIALDISVTSAFNRRLFSRNKFYEIEMVELLGSYQNNGAFTGEYLLLYHTAPDLAYGTTHGKVQASSGSTAFCMNEMFGIDDPSPLVNFLLDTEGSFFLPMEAYGGQEGDMLFGYSFDTVGGKDIVGKASLCFRVTRDQVAERAQFVSGGLGSHFALSMQGQYITPRSQIPQAYEKTITLSYDDFVLAVDMATDPLYATGSRYDRWGQGTYLALLLCLVPLAVWLAKRNYQPTKALLTKYSAVPDRPENELDSLAHLLENAYQDIQSADSRMESQMSLLKNHMLLLLIHGIAPPQVLGTRWVFRDQLAGPLYAILLILMEPRGNDAFLSQIEEFSNVGVSAYLCEHSAGGERCVLLSMREEGAAEGMAQMVRELCEANNHCCRIGIGSAYTAMEQIHRSYVEARKALLEGPSDSTPTAAQPELNARMESILAYIQAHVLQQDFSLSLVAEAFAMNASYFSDLFKRHMNINFSSYIIARRIEAAQGFLRDTDAPIMEICQRVGYGSLSHFIKVFRETTSMTPSAYRAYKMDKNQ